jgi:hypothetical protein
VNGTELLEVRWCGFGTAWTSIGSYNRHLRGRGESQRSGALEESKTEKPKRNGLRTENRAALVALTLGILLAIVLLYHQQYEPAFWSLAVGFAL